MLTRSVKPLQGAAMLALSALLFSLMGVAIREVSVSVNNESVVFFRNLVGVVFFLPLVLIKGFQPLRTQRLKSHLWRTTYGLAAMYCFFYAIAHLPLADAMLFTYSAPVFTPIIAWWLLKESLSKRMLIATCIGLTGVLLVAKPSAALLDSQALIGLAASLLACMVYIDLNPVRFGTRSSKCCARSNRGPQNHWHKMWCAANTPAAVSMAPSCRRTAKSQASTH